MIRGWVCYFRTESLHPLARYRRGSQSVKVVARDLDMKEVKIDAEDLLARAFQHEIDHLNGIVFLDRAEPGTVRKIVIEEEGEETESAAAEQEAR